MLNYIIDNSTLHIEKSYQLKTSKDMHDYLHKLRADNVDYNFDVLKRSDENLLNEWKGHNFLYNIHFMRNHTESVDFEYPQKLYWKIIWGLLSKLYLF